MSITVKELSYSYNKGLPNEEEALSGLSFTAEAGAVTSVLGHTGSGKSTLARHLNALMLPQQGEISVDGMKITKGAKLREIRKKVGHVFQYPESQIFAESVAEEIAFAPRNWGRSEAEIKELIPVALSEVGLDPALAALSPYSLSGGQKRRLAIASVLAAQPDYVVLDEPTAGLDAAASKELLKLLLSLAQAGRGIIYITHDIETALSISSKILVLERGHSVSFDSPEATAELLCRKKITGLVMPELLQLSKKLLDAGRISKLAWTPAAILGLLKEK